MFLTNWMVQYENCMDGIKAQEGIKQFCDLMKDKKIIIYGAGITGKQYAKFFTDWELPLIALIDKYYDRIIEINGITVHPPSWLKTVEDNCCEYVVITAANNVQISTYIQNDFEKLGIASMTLVDGYILHRVLQGLVCLKQLHTAGSLDLYECIPCSRQTFDCGVFTKHAEKVCNCDDTTETNVSRSFDFFGYILGQICTLNCKHCCEKLPYVDKDKRKFVPKDNVIADITKLAAASRLIVRLEFIGGEPFLHPDFASILKEVKKISNIANIQVFTNGTVLPGDDLCKELKHPRVTLSISGYRADIKGEQHQEKIDKTRKKLNQYGIRYVFSNNKTWFDFTSFDYIEDKEENIENLFKSCSLHLVHRLHDGVLYGCAHVYAGAVTNAIPKFEAECLNIREILPEDLPAALERFEELKAYETCKYCSLPFDADEVPAGIQISDVTDKT